MILHNPVVSFTGIAPNQRVEQRVWPQADSFSSEQFQISLVYQASFPPAVSIQMSAPTQPRGAPPSSPPLQFQHTFSSPTRMGYIANYSLDN
ncbi:hypothetical protein GQ457_04G038860 [Hibiscus cannabinus]